MMPESLYQTESFLTACISLVYDPMSQTSGNRVNSRRVRIHEENSGDAVRRLGTIIQSIFCAQSGANIRLTVWKWSSESRYPVAFPPVLENFRRAFSPGPTDRPWVSEDEAFYIWRPSRPVSFVIICENIKVICDTSVRLFAERRKVSRNRTCHQPT